MKILSVNYNVRLMIIKFFIITSVLYVNNGKRKTLDKLTCVVMLHCFLEYFVFEFEYVSNVIYLHFTRD